MITRTKLPVLRAGMGLLMLPIVAIGCVLLAMFGLKGAHSQSVAIMLAGLGAALGLLYFAAIAARISVENGSVRIMRALDEVVIPGASIEHVSVWAFAAWRGIVVTIWRKGRRLPVIADFVVMDTTSAGDLRSTVVAIEKLLHDARSGA